MSGPKKPRRGEEGIIFLETEGDDVARALAEAERAIEAVEDKSRRREAARSIAVAAPEPEPHPAPAPAGPPAPDERRGLLEDQLAEQRERALRAEEQLAEQRERALRAEEHSGRVQEALLRKSADFDNLKRRSEKEKQDYYKFALAEVFHDLLGVLDNFERALAHRGDASNEDFQTGIDMIARQLGETLKKYGVVEVPAVDLLFDPNVHEAVVREETESVAPGMVIGVLQKGYLLNDRLLRPARVKVAAHPAAGDGRDERGGAT
jgi:molecular chaperone GrpE